jgi:hypothetical protein
MLSLFYQFPNCNLFTQHVLFILWRDATRELWTPVLFPSYCYHLFTLLAYFHCFPLDTLIPFVSSKPARLTTSSQVGNKVLGCVCAGSTLLLPKQSLDEAPYKLSGAVMKLASITFSRIVCSSLDRHTFVSYWGKRLAAVLIILSAWSFPTAWP